MEAKDLAVWQPGDRRRRLKRKPPCHGMRSTLIAGQLPIENWHDLIGDATLADAILDRLVHNAYKLYLKGQPMRKSRSKLTAN